MRRKSRPARRLLAAFLAAVAAAGMLAAAQAPILVSAERSTALLPEGDHAQVTYEGAVVITHGAAVIHGDRAVLYMKNQHLDRAVVSGAPATFIWQPQTGVPVHGEAAIITYLAAADTVVFAGRVKVHRESQTLSAAEARYTLKTGTLSARGGTGTNPERVHVVIPPAPPATAPRP
ncbi:MAG TPA: lipopolysaccharide transport periplasmic protein LptA [Gammaproteobacteria bacterium]|nr:lipopolysaccharide transport periplasmic protein LptA [Gammaproteobacteria bacterium]